MKRLSIDWGTNIYGESIANGFGYRKHNENLYNHVSKLVNIHPRAKNRIVIRSPEFVESSLRKKKINWIFSMFEGTDLPSKYLEPLEKADYWLVPSTWVKEVFSKYFDRDKIFVVNHGVSPIFYYKKRKFPHRKKFRYLWVGAPNPRKGYQELVEVWTRQGFLMSKDVELYCKTTGEGIRGKVMQKGNVILDGRILSDMELGNLYRNAHCFVMPHKGEGFGLCVDPNTYIFTSDGTKKMKDIKIGDSVLTKTGNFKKVDDKISRTDRTLKFNIRGTIPSIVTKDHPFLACKTKFKNGLYRNKKGNFTYDWVRARDLKVGDLVAYPRPKLNSTLPKEIDLLNFLDKKYKHDENYIWSNHSYSSKTNRFSISNIMKRHNVSKRIVEDAINILLNKKRGNRNIWVRNNSKCKEISNKLLSDGFVKNDIIKINRYIKFNENFLYLLGWYIAEGDNLGGLGINFSMSKEEYKIAEKLGKIGKELFGINYNIIEKKNKNVCSLYFCSSIISELFTKLCGKLAYHKKVHKILYNSGNNIPMLIKGYVEGDGHKKKKNGGYSITTASCDLVWQIRFILASKGIYCRINKNVRNNRIIWTLNIGGADAKRLCDWTGLYNKTHGKRKPHEWSIITDNFIFTPIRNIERLEKQEVMDIQVKDDHSFVGNGVLLHNTLAEAMSTGMPCVATGYSGVTDFFDSNVGYPIGYNMGEGIVTFVGTNEKQKTQIAYPNLTDLCNSMIHVFENYDEALRKGKKASKRMRKFTWNKSAKTLVDTIRGTL